MPGEGRSIFNKAASEKLRSPDDLEKYVRVTNPSLWVVLVACVALIIGLFAWGILGAVSTSVETTGVFQKDGALCLLDADNVVKVHEGDTAKVGGSQMKVKTVSTTPYSRDEAKGVLGNDYLVSALMDGDWAYAVEFEGESTGALGTPVSVNITTERIAPISLIFGSLG